MKNCKIHIFGYGETQITSPEFSIKVKSQTLTAVTPLLAAILEGKPPASPVQHDEKFHAVLLTVDSPTNVRWMAKEDGFAYRDTEDRLGSLIKNLYDELENVHTSESNNQKDE